MNTKKLQIFTVALLLSIFAFVNTSKAAGTYTLTAGANPALTASWKKTTAPVGSAPNFTVTNNVYKITANCTMVADWTFSGSGSYLLVPAGLTFSDGGFKLNAGTIGNASTSFSVAPTGVATVSGTGTVSVADISGSVTISGASQFGNTTIQAGSLVTVSGPAVLSGVNPISGTLTVTSAAPTLANLTVNGTGVVNLNAAGSVSNLNNAGGIVNFNAAVTVAALTTAAGSTTNFNAAATITSAFTSPGGTVVYNSPGISVFGITFGGNVTITQPATLVSPTRVNGVLTLNADLTIGGSQLTIGGTLAGASTIIGDASGGIVVGATCVGAIGTLKLKAGSQTLGFLDMSVAPSTAILTLGNDLTIMDDGSLSSYIDLSGGTLDLNGKSLIISNNCPTVVIGMAGGGFVKGSATSSIYVSCDPAFGSITGELYMDQTSTSSKSLSVLSLNDGGMAQTLTLGNTLNLVDSLVPTSGTIALGGNLVLYADQTGSGKVGRIAQIQPAATVTGSLTSQIWVDPPANATDWRLLGASAVSGATFADWDDNTGITCLTCPDGYYPGGTAFGSIQSYVENPGAGLTYSDASHYVEIGAITDPMTSGKGFWVYLGNSSPGTSSSGTLLDIVKTPVTTSTPIALTKGAGAASEYGWNLISNPLPSTISWNKLWASNASVDATIYSYSPNYGDFVTYNAATTIAVPSSGSYVMTDVVPQGMGFFVHASANTSLTANESVKVSGNQILFKQANPNATQSSVTYFSIQASGNSMVNEAAILFNSNATTGFDANYDALDLPPSIPGWLQVSSASLGKDYSVNGLPALTSNYSIPVKMTTATTGSYLISTLNLQNMPSGACIILHDNYTGVNHDLRTGSFSVTLTDTETVARFVLNITVTPLQITSNSTQATCHSSNDGFITAIGNNSGPWNYVWKNASNTIVKTSLNKAVADSLLGLGSGVYSVDVTTVGSCDNATQTFTLTAPAATTSAFSVSSATVNVSSNVTFTDNSTNANAFWWTFGDGNSSNMQNPVYAYSAPGVYTVTLNSINTACGYTVTSTKVITVLGTTGISTAASGETVISKDGEGAFIKFNFATQTKVNINVYNELGQMLLVLNNTSVSNDKMYLNLDNAKGQMVFVTVTNTDKNTQITKKIFID